MRKLRRYDTVVTPVRARLLLPSQLTLYPSCLFILPFFLHLISLYAVGCRDFRGRQKIFWYFDAKTPFSLSRVREMTRRWWASRVQPTPFLLQTKYFEDDHTLEFFYLHSMSRLPSCIQINIFFFISQMKYFFFLFFFRNIFQKRQTFLIIFGLIL